MADKRKTDTERRCWFRSNRFFTEEGKWYFHTREGTVEGPFDCQRKAHTNLDIYITLQRSGLYNADFELLPS